VAALNDAGQSDVVIECAGVAETVEAAPMLTRAGGRIVVLGVLPKGARTTIEPFDLLFREITVFHSFLNPFTQARAAAMIAAGTIRAAPLISRVIGPQEALEAIAHPPRPDDVKVVIRP
jgi:L-iditol 2-dehydrogenase